MAKDKVRPPEEGPGGAPKWMVTFSDCMTLLLTFFVLLLSFSSFDDKAFRKMTTSLATALPSITNADTRNRDALYQRDQMILYQKDRDKGSESPTEDGDQDGLTQEDPTPLRFDNFRVFLTHSDLIFLGNGVSLSGDGRRLLSNLAEVLKTQPNKIVISENELQARTGDNILGLKRARTAMRFLINPRYV